MRSKPTTTRGSGIRTWVRFPDMAAVRRRSLTHRQVRGFPRQISYDVAGPLRRLNAEDRGFTRAPWRVPVLADAHAWTRQYRTFSALQPRYTGFLNATWRCPNEIGCGDIDGRCKQLPSAGQHFRSSSPGMRGLRMPVVLGFCEYKPYCGESEL